MSVIAEAESLAELISDCADLPDSTRTDAAAVPARRDAGGWLIDDGCLAQVAGLDDYGM